MDDLSFQIQIRREFIEEANDIIHYFEVAILELENGANRDGIINKLYRDAHTLRSSGQAAGFTGLGRFAQGVENLLGLLRAEKVAMSQTVINALFAGCDGFKGWVQALAKDFDSHYDSSREEALLEACLGPKAAKPAASTSGNSTIARPADQNPARDKPNLVEASEQELPSALTNTLIYVCDDEADVRDMLVELFSPDWEVESFADAKSLLTRLQEKEPHLIVTDLKMPGMTGEVMMEKIRAESRMIPVIFISGHVNRDGLIRFIKLGVVDFFEKPFDLTALLESSRRAVRKVVHEQVLSDLSILAFRTYLRFIRVEDLIDSKSLSEEKRTKLAQLEKDMMRIGELSVGAFRFGVERT